MKANYRSRMLWSLASIALVGLALVWAKGHVVSRAAGQDPVTIKALATRGFAAPGNTLRANLLVTVTDAKNGTPVNGLTAADFLLISHMAAPPAACGFSNGIDTFFNPVPGTYQITVKLFVAGCQWVAQDYLGQVRVSNANVQGQDTFILHIE